MPEDPVKQGSIEGLGPKIPEFKSLPGSYYGNGVILRVGNGFKEINWEFFGGEIHQGRIDESDSRVGGIGGLPGKSVYFFEITILSFKLTIVVFGNFDSGQYKRMNC